MSGSESIGTWHDVFGTATPEVQGIARSLKARITDIDPDNVEVARPGDKSVCYGVGPKKMSEAYAYLMPQTDRVNLGFFRGAVLEDPAGLLEGSGAMMRHIKVRTEAAVAAAAIGALIAASVAERNMSLGRNG